MTIVFETPGLIDIRSFTTLGINAKPNSDNPIGQFGTGLKYAVAVLVRIEAEVVVWIGKDKYSFSKKAGDFRGTPIELIQMRKQKWSLTKTTLHELPFTTQMGRFWEPWQAYREIEANTRDEKGSTWAETARVEDIIGAEGLTRIVVSHEEIEKVWKEKDEIFLPDWLVPDREDENLQLYQKEGKYLFYRGMRVQKLSKPSIFTYNFLSKMDLTEDRTLKYEFQAREALGNFITQVDNRDIIQRVVTAPETAWESDVDFSSWKAPAPKAAFLDTIRESPTGLLRSAVSHFVKFEPQKKAERFHPSSWEVKGEYIFDADQVAVAMKPYTYQGSWNRVAQQIVRVVNSSTDEEREIPPDDDNVPF